jgi:uroporphyrinogen-III synthase
VSARVLVTLAPGALPGLETALAGSGLTVRRQPLLDHQVIAPNPSLGEALATPSAWGAFVVTSPRGAKVLADALAERADQHGWPTIWAVGESTARPLREAGWPVEVGPGGSATHGAAEALAGAMLTAMVRGPVLFLAGEPHRPDLGARLADAGIAVVTVAVYRAVPVADVELLAALDRADLLLVASPALVTALAAQGDAALQPGYVAIGATTATACRAAGLAPITVADHPSTDAVADAVRRAANTLALG